MSADVLPVVILAGGLGTRLRPLTERVPKALGEVNGEPFLAHQLRLLQSRGIERIVLCVGFLGDMIRAFAGDGSRFGLHIDYSEDWPDLRGTAGAVSKALPLLGESFFVLYGDSYLPCDYHRVQTAFSAGNCDGLMTVFANDGRWDTSNVEFVGGRILAYDKKHQSPRMQHIDYGLGVFHSRAFHKGSRDLANVYQHLLDRDRLAAFEVTERFYEVGSLKGISDLSHYLASCSGDRSPEMRSYNTRV
jgi:NDP-sugar pyrophosphorylase family protein